MLTQHPPAPRLAEEPKPFPVMVLPKGLQPGQIAALHALAHAIVHDPVTSPSTSLPSEPNPDLIAAAAAVVTAPVPGHGSVHQWCGRPAQTYARLIRLAATCLDQAEAILSTEPFPLPPEEVTTR